MYKNKYLKYKNKYFGLKYLLGGECDPVPGPDDIDPISWEPFDLTSNGDERISMNRKCYLIDGLYTALMLNDGRIPHTNELISREDWDRFVDAYQTLHPTRPRLPLLNQLIPPPPPPPPPPPNFDVIILNRIRALNLRDYFNPNNIINFAQGGGRNIQNHTREMDEIQRMIEIYGRVPDIVQPELNDISYGIRIEYPHNTLSMLQENLRIFSEIILDFYPNSNIALSQEKNINNTDTINIHQLCIQNEFFRDAFKRYMHRMLSIELGSINRKMRQQYLYNVIKTLIKQRDNIKEVNIRTSATRYIAIMIMDTLIDIDDTIANMIIQITDQIRIIRESKHALNNRDRKKSNR